MRPALRALLLSSVIGLACGSPLLSQDIAVRVEAVRLLERPNAVSQPTHMMPNYRQDLTFRPRRNHEGWPLLRDFLRDIERYEWFFGGYHQISIHYPDNIVQNRDYAPAPMETKEMDRITPLLIGTFDKSDVIHSITSPNLLGRSVKCIQFETVSARTDESYEMCVDDELGTLVRWKVGSETIEDADYSQFEGVWWLAHIHHYINGKLRMEIEQTFSVIDGPIDWAALTPSNPATLHACHQ